MALDEANALVEALLTDELEPERRAKLVALKLSLGHPHALEVSPDHLAELRTFELSASFPALRAQAWLGAAGICAALWCLGGVALYGMFLHREPVMVLAFIGFITGLIHAGIAIAQGCTALRCVERGWLSFLAWMWLAGLVLPFAMSLFSDGNAFIVGTLCAAPSMLVSLAAALLARRLRR